MSGTDQGPTDKTDVGQNETVEDDTGDGDVDEEESEEEPPDRENNENIEEESFGYSLQGTWSEIVGFAKSITSSFETHDVERETIDEWESWRPKSEEERDEMREKTVEKAKVEEGEDVGEMTGEAAEHLSESQKHTSEGEIEKAAEKASESAKSAGKAVEGAGRNMMRAIEGWVYKRITKTNPLYLDNKEFNASLEKMSSLPKKIKKIGNGGEKEEDEQEYKLSIKPQSESVENALDKSFSEDDQKEESKQNG